LGNPHGFRREGFPTPRFTFYVSRLRPPFSSFLSVCHSGRAVDGWWKAYSPTHSRDQVSLRTACKFFLKCPSDLTSFSTRHLPISIWYRRKQSQSPKSGQSNSTPKWMTLGNALMMVFGHNPLNRVNQIPRSAGYNRAVKPRRCSAGI
jgi:hypothetical protein